MVSTAAIIIIILLVPSICVSTEYTIIYIATTRPSAVRFIVARSSYFVLTYPPVPRVRERVCVLYTRMMYIYFNDIKDDR